MILRTSILASLLTASVASAVAQVKEGPIERHRGYWTQELSGSIPAPIRLTISATGDVRVRGANVDRVSFRVVRKVKASSEEEARRIFERGALQMSRRGPAATLNLDDPACGRCAFFAEIEVETPHTLREAVLTTRAGAIEAVGISGGVSVNSAAGSIHLSAIGGGVRAETAGGNIDLGQIGGPVRCETAGGSISLDQSGGEATLSSNGGKITVGTVSGALRAETLGGDIEAQKVGGRVTASTFGGSIHIGEADGEVIADTAGGSIEVARAGHGVRAETPNGDILLTEVAGRIYATTLSGSVQAHFVSGRPLANSLIETTGGAIVIWLPADIRIAIDAQVDFAGGGGRIESEFPAIVVNAEEEGFGPRAMRASGELNGGGPTLTIRNTSGKILIRRRQ